MDATRGRRALAGGSGSNSTGPGPTGYGSRFRGGQPVGAISLKDRGGLAKALPTLATFLSYNPTGLNEQKCDWLNSLCNTCDVTYVSIQEHFRKSKTIDKFFTEQFQEYNLYVIPGFRNKGTDHGRPKAGWHSLVEPQCL